MATPPSNIESLKISLTERRRAYDRLCDLHEGVRGRILLLLGGVFTFFGYLYGGGDTFMPRQYYGIIIYCLAFVLTISGAATLLVSLAPVKWRIPGDLTDEYKDMSEEENLKYLNQEYCEAFSMNIKHNQRKNMMFIAAFLLILIGATLLLIFKNFVGKGEI